MHIVKKATVKKLLLPFRILLLFSVTVICSTFTSDQFAETKASTMTSPQAGQTSQAIIAQSTASPGSSAATDNDDRQIETIQPAALHTPDRLASPPRPIATQHPNSHSVTKEAELMDPYSYFSRPIPVPPRISALTIPEYPGTRLTSKLEEEFSFKKVYTVAADPLLIIEFYRKELPKHGWKSEEVAGPGHGWKASEAPTLLYRFPYTSYPNDIVWFQARVSRSDGETSITVLVYPETGG